MRRWGSGVVEEVERKLTNDSQTMPLFPELRSSSLPLTKKDDIMREALSAYVHTILNYIRDQAITTYDRLAKHEADAFFELQEENHESERIQRASRAHTIQGRKASTWGFGGG